MREVRISDMFHDFGLFDMKQIKENLEDYVGYSFKDICLKFCNMYNEIVDVKLIRDYCMENFDKGSLYALKHSTSILFPSTSIL